MEGYVYKMLVRAAILCGLEMVAQKKKDRKLSWRQSSQDFKWE